MSRSILVIFVLSILFLCGSMQVYAYEDINHTMEVGDTYDINGDEWLDLYTVYSYSLDREGIVSVSDDLIVTGLNYGITYLTINYGDENGSYQMIFKFYINIVEGVYRIKNNETGKYLCPEKEAIRGDIGLECKSYSENINLLWKFEKVESESEGLFIIRPYVDKKALLVLRNPEKKIYVTESKLEYIEDFENNSLFNFNVYAYRGTIRCETGNIIYSNESGVTLGSSNVSGQWSFEQVNTLPEGYEICDTYNGYFGSVSKRYISKGDTKSMNELKIKVVEYSGQPSTTNLEWSSDNSYVATVNEETGEVTGVNPGITHIRCKKSINGKLIEKSYIIEVMALVDGIYSLSGYANSFTLSQYQSEFQDLRIRMNKNGSSNFGKNVMDVYLSLDIDGYYQISCIDELNASILSQEKYCFGLPDGNLENFLTLMYNTRNDKDSLKWYIEKSEVYNGYYVIYPKLSSYNEHALYMGDTTFIIPSLFEEEDYDFYWKIEPITTNYNLGVTVYPVYEEAYKDLFESEVEMITLINELVSYLNTNFTKEFNLSVECGDIISHNDINDDDAETNIFQEFAKYYYGTDTVTAEQSELLRNKNILLWMPGEKMGTSNPQCVILNEGTNLNDYYYGLLHEMAHMIGAPDHYHDVGSIYHNTAICSICADFKERRDIGCIMNYYDYNTAEPFCSDCKREVMIHLYNHHACYN